MLFSTIRRMWAQMRPSRRLSCRRRLWTRLLLALRERGEGRRESGAFLLGRRVGDRRVVQEFILYDDVDPGALQGIIVFDASRMDAVWRRCRELGLEVIADVHTHPGGYGQSATDQAHPMIPQAGHLALIVPRFASELVGPGSVGVYEYLGRGAWRDHSDRGRAFFEVTWP
jgi:proteasome lid subunit RPN8/RPN11